MKQLELWPRRTPQRPTTDAQPRNAQGRALWRHRAPQRLSHAVAGRTAEVLWVHPDQSSQDTWYAIEDLFLRSAAGMHVHAELRDGRWHVTLHGIFGRDDAEVRALAAVATDPGTFVWCEAGQRGSFVQAVLRQSNDLTVVLTSVGTITRWPQCADLGWQVNALMFRLRCRDGRPATTRPQVCGGARAPAARSPGRRARRRRVRARRRSEATVPATAGVRPVRACRSTSDRRRPTARACPEQHPAPHAGHGQLRRRRARRSARTKWRAWRQRNESGWKPRPQRARHAIFQATAYMPYGNHDQHDGEILMKYRITACCVAASLLGGCASMTPTKETSVGYAIYDIKASGEVGNARLAEAIRTALQRNTSRVQVNHGIPPSPLPEKAPRFQLVSPFKGSLCRFRLARVRRSRPALATPRWAATARTRPSSLASCHTRPATA